jgi:4-diphosphocytidyl-2-C-methyl-D-erythritol kinase
MLLYPNCKINIGLRVINKREDGYHNIETVFVPIFGLHDELEVNKSDKFHFTQEGIVVDCSADDNLIIRCYRQMSAKYSSIGAVDIRFKKNIPFGAGLGGGSSDAAHMAIALNELFSLGLTKAQLASEVRSLGADCPFFIYNTPCYASGIGDELLPIELDMRGLRILMVKPDEGVSTKEAYGGIIRHPEVANAIIEKVETTSNLKELLTSYPSIFINDFEQTVFPLHPSIESIKKRLLDANALYACMSGSGSTVFGLFEDDSEGRSDSQLCMLEQEFSSMILLNDTLG